MFVRGLANSLKKPVAPEKPPSWEYQRGIANTLKNPMAPEKPLPRAYLNYLERKDRFWASERYTHNIRGNNYSAYYVAAPLFCAIFVPFLFWQKCLGNRGN